MSAPWSLIADSAALASAAYRTSDSLPGLLSGIHYGLVPDSFRTFDNFATHGVAFAAVSGNTVVISFRGTDSGGEWFMDAVFWAEVQAFGRSPTFLEYAGLFVDHVRTLVENALPGTEIIFTGHSLGGMLAEQFTQWYYDPTDPYNLAPDGRLITGISFGSPGLRTVVPVPEGKFFHITRYEDPVGTRFPDKHIGPTFFISDPESTSLDLNIQNATVLAHSSERYASQAKRIFASVLSKDLQFQSSVLFLPDGAPNTISPSPSFSAVFGGTPRNVILASTGSILHAEGGDNRDLLVGNIGDDILVGGGDEDELRGGIGTDRLFGGDGGDRYVIRPYEGYDLLSDGGQSGTDVIAVIAGELFDRIRFGWFSVDDNDLLIRATATDGSLAINVRVIGMGSTSGSLELLDLYAADGVTLIDSWDLDQLWINLGQPPPPPEPVVTPSAQSTVFTSGNDNIVRGDGNDVLTTRGEGADSVDFGGGDDLLIVDYSWGGSSVFASQYLNSYRFGASPIGESYAYNVERVYVTGGSAADNVQGLAGDDALVGGPGDDALSGLAGNDSLLGGAGNDILLGGSGFDWLDGGSGDDYAEINLSDETRAVGFLSGAAASAAGFTLVDGTHVRNVERISLQTGSGDDRIWLQGYNGPPGTQQGVSTAAGSDELHFTFLAGRSGWDGGDGEDQLIADLSAESRSLSISLNTYPSGDIRYGYIGAGTSPDLAPFAEYLVFSGVERLTVSGGSGGDAFYGGTFADVFVGNGGNDYLQGGGGNDRLEGGSGDDNLLGGAGVNFFDGGAGSDFAEVDLAGETRSVSYSTALAASAAGQTLVDGSHLRNVEKVSLVTGTGNDIFSIRGGDQYVSSGAGNDELNFTFLAGRSGWDGGDGEDQLIADLSAESRSLSISLNTYPSGDIRYGYIGAGTSPDLAPFAEYLVFSGVERLTVSGGSGGDAFYGGTFDDVFIGNGGNDYLNGGAGNDRLEGGSGEDNLIGGAGVNFFDGGAGIDFAELNLADETCSVVYSSTQVASAAGQTLVDGSHLRNVEKVSLVTGSGNDIFSIRGGDQYVSSFGGDDELTFTQLAGRSGWSGGGGADHLIVDLSAESDGFTIYIWGLGFGTGYVGRGQSLDLAPFANYLGFDSVERLTVTGSSGNDNLYGLLGDDVFVGNGGDDYLYGDGGNDRLEGSSGDDNLDGGSGNDRLIGGTSSDIMTGGQGADIFLYLAATDSTAAAPDRIYGFESGLDRIDLTRVGAQSATWSVLNDPNSGPYSLVTVALPTGTMTIRVDGQVALSDFILVSQFVGTGGNDQLAGTDGADLIQGEGGNDFLYLQQGGEDRALGGDGNDVIYFGGALSAGDVADGGAGRDAIVLQGNVTAALTDTNLVGIESISIQSGANTQFGDTANNFYDYNVKTADGNVAAGQQLIVNAQSLRAGEDFTFDGSAETNGSFRVFGGHGTDILKGGAGVDVFFFEGQRWGPNDRVDGGGGRDSLVISAGSGLTHIEFAADSFTNIESISVNNLYATDPSQKPSYDLVLNNGNVAPGQTLIVNGSSIPGGQFVAIDGRAVQGGNLILFGGGGHDTLSGGQGGDLIVGGGGADSLTGGAGADTFRYDAASDSAPGLADLIGDFQGGLDKVDLTRIDANSNAAGDQAFSWIGSGAFTGVAGQLRTYDQGGYRWVAGDTDGNGVADFAIAFQAGTAPLGQGDFLL